LEKRRRRIVKNKRGPHLSRRNYFPSNEESKESVITSFELKEYFTCGKFPVSIPLSQDPDITPSKDVLNRRRLQNRPLMLNARQVFQVQWGGWWQRCWPTLVAASMQVSYILDYILEIPIAYFNPKYLTDGLRILGPLPFAVGVVR